jgi:hypothetical protein
MDHIAWIHNHDKKVCDTPFCWHDAMDVVGKHCPINALRPPCTRFDDDNKILNAIKSNAPLIKHDLAQRVKNQLRKVPNLIFYIDDSLDYIEKIDKALTGEENPIENRDL